MRHHYDIDKIHQNYMDTSCGRTRISLDWPTVDYKKAFLSTCIVSILTIICIQGIDYFLRDVLSVTDSVYCAIIIALGIDSLVFGRWVAIWFVTVYQSRAKIEVRMRCCFEPSCSEYAILAFERYGLLIGGIKAIKRVRRCHPPGGIDYP